MLSLFYSPTWEEKRRAINGRLVRAIRMKDAVRGTTEAKKLALHMLPGSLLTKEDLNGGRWHDCAPEWPLSDDIEVHGKPAQRKKGDEQLQPSLKEWWEVGESAVSAVSRAYEKRISHDRGGGTSFLSTVTKKGTLADKLAAITLKVQESPLHRMNELESLLDMVEKRGRKERGSAIDVLGDLFINDLLPDGRRLIAFERRSFCAGVSKISKRHLAYAVFESQLKRMYARFLEVLEDCSRDTVIYFKQKAVHVTFNLLCAKPENEAQLLGMLVNKLGDPERKVASLVSFSLTQLIRKHHSAMRPIVVKEIDEFLHRSNVGRRAQYYAVCFLNQMKFSRSDEDIQLTRTLLRIYMSLFAACIVQGQNESSRANIDVSKAGLLETRESRLMEALLTGINRAFPFTNPEGNDADYNKELDALFKVAHARSFGPATQSLRFLFKVAQARQTVSDRYYRALYSRISDLPGVSETKQALFVNLLVQSMKVDTSRSRVRAFAKRLLQSTFSSAPGYAAGVLLLISEILLVRKKILKGAVTVPEVDEDLREKNVKDSPSSVVKVTTDQESLEQRVMLRGRSAQGTEESGAKSETLLNVGYDPDKRDPLYAGAENSCLWELVVLSTHYHPSVAKFASQLVNAVQRLKYPGDPLKDFAQSSFLDRFCCKKPKRNVIDSLHGRRAARVRNTPLVNSDAFLKMGKAGQVTEDDKFYVRYFQYSPLKTRSRKIESTQKSSDAEMEEAYESAIRAEMKRMNGVMDPESGDVDPEDSDELEALENAFKEELGAENDTGLSNESGNLLGHARSESSEGVTGKESKSFGFGSFAPAEDYAAYLKEEASSSASEEEEEVLQGDNQKLELRPEDPSKRLKRIRKNEDDERQVQKSPRRKKRKRVNR